MKRIEVDELYDLVQALKRAGELANALQGFGWSDEIVDLLCYTQYV